MKKPKNDKQKKRKGRSGSFPSRRPKKKHVWLNVLPEDLWLRVRRGKTILEALEKTDVELEGDCGGLGKCGKCKVKVLTSIGPPSEEARELLDEDEIKQGIRLACRTRIKKDLTIYVGEPDTELEYFQILKIGERPVLELDPLLDKRLVSIPPELRHEGLSDLDRIKLVLGPEYENLKASLHCLGTLSEALKKTEFKGTAVLHDNYLMAWQPREEVGRRYGLVFDLGTSTLVGKLISLLDGREVGAVSCLNSQIRHGTNVISRLQYVQEHPRGIQHMHNLLVHDLNRITRRLLEMDGLEPDEVFVAVAAGNTTMQHFLLNLDPEGIARAPFSPVVTDGLVIRATDVGIKLHPEARLYVMPVRAGYIGGDLIAAILASGAAEQTDEIVLGLDLGTNGEIFLGNGKKLMTCSTAAGPALEGAKISHGMIAKAGALEGVSAREGELEYRVIGNIKPKGICGSGLVDLLAVLLHLGIINHEGLILNPKELQNDNLAAHIFTREEVNNFIVVPPEQSYYHKPIFLTQKDVRELQLAKAAIAAGIQTLMDEMDVGPQDIGHVYLAGALGNYVNPFSAMRIGLIPRVKLDIVRSLGNAASTGASMVLLAKHYWRMANKLADSIEHVELSTRKDFNQYFIEQMDFPEENLW